MKFIDLHNDIPLGVYRYKKEGRKHFFDEFMHEIYHDDNLSAMVAAIYTDNESFSQGNAEKNVLNIADTFIDEISCSSNYCLVRNKNEYKQCKFNGKRAVFLALEGCEPIKDNSSINIFYDLGFRIMSLTWNRDNKYAYGCGLSKSINKGQLTKEGRRLIDKFEELNIMLDLSHINDDGFRFLMDNYGGKKFVSHTGIRKFIPLSRNISDDSLNMVKQNNCILGLCSVSMLIGKSKEIMADAIIELKNMGLKLALGLDISDERIISGKYDTYYIDGEKVISYDNISSYSDLTLLIQCLEGKGMNREEIADIFYNNSNALFDEL